LGHHSPEEKGRGKRQSWMQKREGLIKSLKQARENPRGEEN